MKKNGKIILLCIAVLCVLMAGMYFVYQRFVPKAQEGEKHVVISIVYDDGTQKDIELDTDAAYLLEALSAVADIDAAASGGWRPLYDCL